MTRAGIPESQLAAVHVAIRRRTSPLRPDKELPPLRYHLAPARRRYDPHCRCDRGSAPMKSRAGRWLRASNRHVAHSPPSSPTAEPSASIAAMSVGSGGPGLPSAAGPSQSSRSTSTPRPRRGRRSLLRRFGNERSQLGEFPLGQHVASLPRCHAEHRPKARG
jgi:hypothetical protein